MSHNIFKSFAVKDGVAKMVDAESNVHNAATGAYCFHAYERPFYPESPIALHSFDYHAWSVGDEHYPAQVKGEPILVNGETVPNEWYGLTDEEIIAKWMLGSAYSGDKYYQQKWKEILRLCEDWAIEKQNAYQATWLMENGLPADFEADWKWWHEAAENPAYTPYRFDSYHLESKEELAELVAYLRANKDRYKRHRVRISFGCYTVKKAYEGGGWKADYGDYAVKLSKSGIAKVVARIAEDERGFGVPTVEYI